MKCGDCPDYKTCHRQNDLRRKRHKCKKANEPFVQTNADRIRAMSDEELAKFLCSILDCESEKCPGLAYCALGKNGCADWLKQPAKDGDG